MILLTWRPKSARDTAAALSSFSAIPVAISRTSATMSARDIAGAMAGALAGGDATPVARRRARLSRCRSSSAARCPSRSAARRRFACDRRRRKRQASEHVLCRGPVLGSASNRR